MFTACFFIGQADKLFEKGIIMLLSHIFKVEVKRHFTVFAVLTILSGISSLHFLLNHNQELAFTYLLINMVIGILLPIYIFMDYYNEFFIGKMTLNHMLPIKTSHLFLIKSIVFLIGIMMVWGATLIEIFFNPQGLYHARVMHSTNLLECILYLFASKFFGMLSGLALMGFAISLAKWMSKKVATGHVLMAGTIIAVIGIQFTLIRKGAWHYALGTSSLESFKQYANMLSVSIFSNQPTFPDISETINWNSVVMNLIVFIITGSLAALMLNSKKYEVYGK
ncbi:hypothetical protein [Paenibacillus brasilensis]|uniref:ABC transporter, permease protein n=1 Tax=Paenibacillus brasilensis TaxID=128574 RepID=A0ABU0KY99_9BACL|nr:hypothetical protein [Paenibacillus brasilensis]MDQ0494385.1 hypothetical protein [Paenibacillus brasilensis]